MNKSIIYTILAAFACCACAKTVTESGQGDGNALMSFSAYTGREVTKAAVTDVTTDNLTSFKVNGYVKGTAVSYFGEEQTATKSETVYNTTGTTYYWPIGTALDFFAYCGTGVGSGKISNTNGTASIAYTVPLTADEDFVVSYALNCSKPSTGGTQPLTFSHALAKVNKVTIQAKDSKLGEKYRFKVTELKIKEAKNASTYTFNTGVWGSLSGSANYEFAATQGDNTALCFGGTPLVLNVPSTNPAVFDQLIVLPQTVTFSITYSVEYKGGETWYPIMASATKTTTLEMGKGKAYNITFSLPNDGTKIDFSATAVETWTSTDAPITF